MLFKSFMQRMGLDSDEAELVDELTANVQRYKSWIDVQATLRAHGMDGKLSKGEAAILLIVSTIDSSAEIDERDITVLLKGISAVWGYQYQKLFCSNAEAVFKRPDLYNKVKDIIANNEDLLELQYAKSRDLYDNRGFFEKLLG